MLLNMQETLIKNWPLLGFSLVSVFSGIRWCVKFHVKRIEDIENSCSKKCHDLLVTHEAMFEKERELYKAQMKRDEARIKELDLQNKSLQDDYKKSLEDANFKLEQTNKLLIEYKIKIGETDAS